MTPDAQLMPLDQADGLANFMPAADLASPLRGQSPSEAPLSVADLKASGVSIEWYEAIALVQAACRAIIEGGDLIGPTLLEPHGIFIDGAGGVTVTATGSGNASSAVQALGYLLANMLPANDVLLLGVRVVADAISSPSRYQSLEEFSQALAYYERPNRRKLLQALYDRSRGIPRTITEPPAADAESVALALNAVAAGPHSRPRSYRAAAAAMIILVVLAGVGAVVFKVHLSSVRSVLQLPQRTFDAIGSRIATVFDPPGTAPAPPSPPTTRPAVDRKRVPKIAIPRPAPAEQSVGGESAKGLPPEGHAVRVDWESLPGPVTSPAPPSPSLRDVVDLNTASNLVVDPVTYSARDVDVAPPTVVFPQFLLLADTGPYREDLPIIEIVVNKDGRVDFVKAQAAPHSLGEYMQVTTTLSAAKSWRFQPAVKDGQLVRYRALMVLVIH
jgi:hypothetical protein